MLHKHQVLRLWPVRRFFFPSPRNKKTIVALRASSPTNNRNIPPALVATLKSFERAKSRLLSCHCTQLLAELLTILSSPMIAASSPYHKSRVSKCSSRPRGHTTKRRPMNPTPPLSSEPEIHSSRQGKAIPTALAPHRSYNASSQPVDGHGYMANDPCQGNSRVNRRVRSRFSLWQLVRIVALSERIANRHAPARRHSCASPTVCRDDNRRGATVLDCSALERPTLPRMIQPPVSDPLGGNSVKPLPQRYGLADPLDIMCLILRPLSRSVRTNDAALRDMETVTRFHSKRPPSISVNDYLERITVHARLTPPMLLCIAVYLDKLRRTDPKLAVCSLTVHRLVLACATVSIKAFSDYTRPNCVYSHLGGVSTGELATLELELLKRISWEAVPNEEKLTSSYLALVAKHSGYEIQPERFSERVLDGLAKRRAANIQTKTAAWWSKY